MIYQTGMLNKMTLISATVLIVARFTEFIGIGWLKFIKARLKRIQFRVGAVPTPSISVFQGPNVTQNLTTWAQLFKASLAEWAR